MRKFINRKLIVCSRDDFFSNCSHLCSQCGTVGGDTTLTNATTSEIPKIDIEGYELDRENITRISQISLTS